MCESPSETGLYYLNSRYYDPETGRFINADKLLNLNNMQGSNLFCYARNNPLKYKDDCGMDAVLIDNHTIESGMLFLGHAQLYIQDENDNWYFTEYAGKIGEIPTVRTYKVDDSESLQSQLDKMINNKYVWRKDYVYIEGDYSESANYANTMADSENGGYRFLSNNCVDYAIDTLSKGKPAAEMVNRVFMTPRCRTAGSLLTAIKNAMNLDRIVKFFKH